MVLALTQLVLVLAVTGGLTTLHDGSSNCRSISLASQFIDLDPLRVDLHIQNHQISMLTKLLSQHQSCTYRIIIRLASQFSDLAYQTAITNQISMLITHMNGATSTY
jgi:hypothetical protein